jgi:hypothetical protein
LGFVILVIQRIVIGRVEAVVAINLNKQVGSNVKPDLEQSPALI